MATSKIGIAAVAAGLVAAAMGGCSPSVEAGPTVQAQSDVPGVKLVALSDLPRSPERGTVDEPCEGHGKIGLTRVGEQVAERGWIVTSEAAVGRYRTVTFVSGFDQGTSGVCVPRNANIGVFEGGQLVALAYSPKGSDEVLGELRALEGGALAIERGGYPGAPIGELHAEGDRLRLKTVAPAQTFCSQRVSVPNVYGQSIDEARKTFLAQGWRPEPAAEAPDEYGREAALIRRGVVEVDNCSGTGMGFCGFEYRGPDGVLRVTTIGGSDESENAVIGYEVTCRDAQGLS